jgi:hypothetical protein
VLRRHELDVRDSSRLREQVECTTWSDEFFIVVNSTCAGRPRSVM